MREPEHPAVACTVAASVVIQIEAAGRWPSKSTLRIPICEQHRQALPDLLSAWAGRVLAIQEG
jgi:hypothetical protein